MWANYFGNYVCCRDYFGSEHGWNHQEDWYKPGIMLRLTNIYGLTVSQIYACLNHNIFNHSLLKTQLISSYGNSSNINAAFSFYGH